MREKEWCINYPNQKYYPQSFDTINHNGLDNDEITDAGFHIEQAQIRFL